MNVSTRQGAHGPGVSRSSRAPLLGQARRRRIAELLTQRGEATVKELADLFDVSGMTIRRDLGELERAGLAERTHGGAVVPSGNTPALEPPLQERFGHQGREKRRIARAVAGMVIEGETVFLGSGTTTLEVAKALPPDRRLTVVTNAVTIITALAGAARVEVVVTGGVLRRDEMSLIGHFAEEALRDVHVDKVIIGTRGVDPERGLTSDHLPELMTDRAILATGREVIVAADHTKLGQVGASRMAPVTAASTLVTGKRAPSALVDAIRAAGVRVLLV